MCCRKDLARTCNLLTSNIERIQPRRLLLK
ncbi:hypothetical protein F383_25732 [Gossypium arboreum]|uniref:Uncharacterized protein n=1 Tax=Gossypium arboreum TaxID=29729 RepID=A0A0B0P3H1_GOSAR|nr:hypothetical protein F383_25732 [Gossypium arboreum]